MIILSQQAHSSSYLCIEGGCFMKRKSEMFEEEKS